MKEGMRDPEQTHEPHTHRWLRQSMGTATVARSAEDHRSTTYHPSVGTVTRASGDMRNQPHACDLQRPQQHHPHRTCTFQTGMAMGVREHNTAAEGTETEMETDTTMARSATIRQTDA